MHSLTLFLCGDVMTGRGIDQVLPHPGDPRLFEPYVRSASRYVALAEDAHGPIPKPVDYPYMWGDALDELDRIGPDARVINLETSVTTCSTPWPGKHIHYRMHPRNVHCLTAAGIDCCVLANNHVLDWGVEGLLETLDSLHGAGLRTAGAGRDLEEARRPVVLSTEAGARVLVFSLGLSNSGIPRRWAARSRRPGVHFAVRCSSKAVDRVAASVQRFARVGDVVVASIHWGGNWGYDVTREERVFAHALIDRAGVHVVHGHSSHHPKPIEVYEGRPIIYGCGDFLNDYEGIAGHESFRDDLVLMYFPTIDLGSGKLRELRLVPLQIRRFRLHRASVEDTRWLSRTLSREGEAFGTLVERRADDPLWLRWKGFNAALNARTALFAPPRRTTGASAPRRRTHAPGSA
jgi:poly-gamma-glutamate capsule biosynthesis protein CapA/YwtB (metallophosphatase superfamily)